MAKVIKVIVHADTDEDARDMTLGPPGHIYPGSLKTDEEWHSPSL